MVSLHGYFYLTNRMLKMLRHNPLVLLGLDKCLYLFAVAMFDV